MEQTEREKKLLRLLALRPFLAATESYPYKWSCNSLGVKELNSAPIDFTQRIPAARACVLRRGHWCREGGKRPAVCAHTLIAGRQPRRGLEA